MPQASDLFPQLEQLDVIALNERYNFLLEQSPRTDDHLLEMVSITGILRRKSAGPPRAKRAASVTPPTLDML